MIHHDVLGVRVDDVSDHELDEMIFGWLGGDALRCIVTPNPEIVLAARKNAEFRERLNRADLALPDGVGLSFAISLLTGNRLTDRHTGVDTLLRIAKTCQKMGKRLVLFGGKSGSGFGEAAAERLREAYPGLDVLALDPREVSMHARDEAPHGAAMLALLHPDAVAIALGQEKQEWFMEAMAKHVPGVKVAIGVGGAFEMLSGRLPRAPKWMRRAGLEWLWRVCIEPARFPRTLRATMVFPAAVVWAKMRHL